MAPWRDQAALPPLAASTAYAELDERYAAGEAVPHAAVWQRQVDLRRTLAARDWERLATTFAPESVLEEHRPLGLFESLPRDAWLASVRALLDLRPDAVLRVTHVLAIADRGVLMVARWEGASRTGRSRSRS